QHVAGARAAVAPDQGGIDQADRDQAVDRLHRVDGVAAGDGDAGVAAGAGAAVEDARDRLRGEHVHRHAHQGQGEQRGAAHGVDVADRVGGGDAAEVVRIVDDGHEEVGGRHDRLALVDAVHGGVVG